MRAAIDQNQPVLPVRKLRQIQKPAFVLVDSHVDHFVAQQLLHDLAVLLDDLQRDAREFALDRRNLTSKKLDDDRLRRPDDNAPVEPCIERPSIAFKPVDEVVDLPDIFHQLGTGLGDLNAMRHALEQLDPQLRFEIRHASGRGRHCQAELVGGPGNAAFIRDGQYQPDCRRVEFHCRQGC